MAASPTTVRISHKGILPFVPVFAIKHTPFSKLNYLSLVALTYSMTRLIENIARK